jgi:hypothetical protein
MDPGEEFPGQEEVFPPRHDTRRQFTGSLFQAVIVPAKKGGQFPETIDDPRVVLSQAGQEIAAEAVAEVGVGAVGAVIAAGEPFPGEVLFYLLPTDVEEGVDDPVPVAQGGDPSEARGAGPAEETHEDCFRLVVGGVSQGDAGEFSPAHRFEEEGEARLPGGLLEGPARRRNGAAPRRRSEVERELVASGQVTDEVGVGF